MSFNYEQLQSSSDNTFKDIFDSRKKGNIGGMGIVVIQNKNRFVKYFMFGGLLIMVVLVVIFVSKTKELSKLNEEKMNLNMHINQISGEEMQLKQSLSNGNAEKENIMKENEKLTNSIKELKQRKNTLMNKKEDIIIKLNDIKKKLSTIQDEIEIIKDTNKETEKKLRYIEEDGEDKYTSEINKLRKKIKELESKIEDAEYNNKDPFKTKSKILTSSQDISTLQRLLGSNYDLDLVYSSTKENYSSYEFHINVGNKRPTVSLIKLRNGQVIGGYTSQSWNGNGFKEDKDAFIFNLSKERMYPVREPTQAIYCDEKYGVVFGKGDILITDNECTSNFPSSYGKRGSSELELTEGNYVIQMEAIEVFTLN